MVTQASFCRWAESVAPLLSSTLSTFFHTLLFPDRPFPPSRTPFLFPRFHGDAGSFLLGGTRGDDYSQAHPRMFTLACLSPSLGDTWHRLFSSDHDGLSFNRLLLSLLGYGGPTLIIITSTSGGTFGAFTSSRWKESGSFYGSSDCFLYQLEPVTGVYHPRGGGGSGGGATVSRNYMYCNPESRSKGYDNQEHGIGFGGDPERPRLFLAEGLDGCVALSDDLTFDRGELLPPLQDDDDAASRGRQHKYFDVERLEVWGVGGDVVVREALAARLEHRNIAAANIRKARKVDKAQFLDDFKSGLIASKAFQHQDQIRGRDGVHAEDED